MKRIYEYILGKYKISNNICENEKILIDFLQLTDNKLINAITGWFNEYNVIDISLHINEKYLWGFKRNASQNWDGMLNQKIFKGESFLCKNDEGNFDILKHIINGSKDYSKLSNILLYDSLEDKLALYGNNYGLYIKHEDYEAIILKKNKD